MKKTILKYFAEFLVVFLGILLSFFIDNSVKLNSKVENKNQLLIQLSEVIEKDLEQLKIIDSTLLSVEKSLDYFYVIKNNHFLAPNSETKRLFKKQLTAVRKERNKQNNSGRKEEKQRIREVRKEKKRQKKKKAS